MRKLDAQHIKNDVVKKLAVGEPQTSIAEQVGVDQSTISPIVIRFIGNAALKQLQAAGEMWKCHNHKCMLQDA